MQQTKIFSTGWDQRRRTAPQVRLRRPRRLPVPLFLLCVHRALLSLFEAARAARLPGVEMRWDGVWYHTFQDVTLCGHDVFDQEVCSFSDVNIVLNERDKTAVSSGSVTSFHLSIIQFHYFSQFIFFFKLHTLFDIWIVYIVIIIITTFGKPRKALQVFSVRDENKMFWFKLDFLSQTQKQSQKAGLTSLWMRKCKPHTLTGLKNFNGFVFSSASLSAVKVII